MDPICIVRPMTIDLGDATKANEVESCKAGLITTFTLIDTNLKASGWEEVTITGSTGWISGDFTWVDSLENTYLGGLGAKTNQDQRYKIYRFMDAYAATDPVYLKVSFCVGGTSGGKDSVGTTVYQFPYTMVEYGTYCDTVNGELNFYFGSNTSPTYDAIIGQSFALTDKRLQSKSINVFPFRMTGGNASLSTSRVAFSHIKPGFDYISYVPELNFYSLIIGAGVRSNNYGHALIRVTFGRNFNSDGSPNGIWFPLFCGTGDGVIASTIGSGNAGSERNCASAFIEKNAGTDQTRQLKYNIERLFRNRLPDGTDLSGNKLLVPFCYRDSNFVLKDHHGLVGVSMIPDSPSGDLIPVTIQNGTKIAYYASTGKVPASTVYALSTVGTFMYDMNILTLMKIEDAP